MLHLTKFFIDPTSKNLFSVLPLYFFIDATFKSLFFNGTSKNIFLMVPLKNFSSMLRFVLIEHYTLLTTQQFSINEVCCPSKVIRSVLDTETSYILVKINC